ncbi:Leucine-rich repeat-containing protein 75A [Dissostichus eleginoides]|uniref:Leucine-rich repeat-containing protein 75A n=1 Tax=Dissostichus eleginoides TaxID=100907 RepID=A0AAD9BGY3_DISEL|nr:Leucine-rich repeat-containing protein 75A [Dissostichus eleginoides]
MGSKLTRQRSLDFETKVSKRRRQRNDSPGESERSGDFLFTSLMLKSDKLPGMLRRTNHCPYVRRVAWIREIQRLLREQKMEQAGEVLKLLRKSAVHLIQDSFINSINDRISSNLTHENSYYNNTKPSCSVLDEGVLSWVISSNSVTVESRGSFLSGFVIYEGFKKKMSPHAPRKNAGNIF